MKKATISIFTAVVMLFSLCGCGKTNATKTYEDFQISFPQSWTINTDTAIEDSDESTPFLYVTATSDEDVSSYFYAVYMTIDAIGSLDEIDQDFGDSWAEILSDSININMTCDDVSIETFGGRDGALVTFSGSSNALDLTYIEQLVPDDGMWYVFTYLIIDKQNEKEMKSVIDSVRFN